MSRSITPDRSNRQSPAKLARGNNKLTVPASRGRAQASPTAHGPPWRAEEYPRPFRHHLVNDRSFPGWPCVHGEHFGVVIPSFVDSALDVSRTVIQRCRYLLVVDNSFSRLGHIASQQQT